MPMRHNDLLLFGFLPFNGHAINPAQMLVEASECPGEVLPVVLTEALPMASRALARHQPKAVVALGQSNADVIQIERIAVNLAHFTIPDEAGAQPTQQTIVADGPPSHPATLPTQQICAALHAEGIPVATSDSAGTYLCNALMYHLLHSAQEATKAPFIAGFIHVPQLPSQAAQATAQGKDAAPTMPFALIQRGLQIALDTIRVYLTQPSPPPHTRMG